MKMNDLKEYFCSSTLTKLNNDIPVSIQTLDQLCKIFNCKLNEIAIYINDDEYFINRNLSAKNCKKQIK